MPISRVQLPNISSPPLAAPAVSSVGVWRVYEYAEVPSTNLIAANFPAWHAVRADTQTAGRGRFQRDWVSDPGGLWMSCVVPLDLKAPAARILPLAAGLALCDVLRDLRVKELHMRWPNDVLVGGRKLAGLLIDQIVPGLAIVGIGMNVANHPERCDLGLRGQVARLAELVIPTPSISELMRAVLAALKSAWRELTTRGPESLLPRINVLWRTPLPVQLDLDGRSVTGDFHGVDSHGRLELRVDGSETRLFEPQQVRLLRELS